MPARKTAKQTGGGRNIVTIPLTARANLRVNEWCDRTGGSKTRFVERLVEFWAAAPDSVQRLMLGDVLEDLSAETVQRAAEYFAAVAAGDEIGTPPKRPDIGSTRR